VLEELFSICKADSSALRHEDCKIAGRILGAQRRFCLRRAATRSVLVVLVSRAIDRQWTISVRSFHDSIRSAHERLSRCSDRAAPHFVTARGSARLGAACHEFTFRTVMQTRAMLSLVNSNRGKTMTKTIRTSQPPFRTTFARIVGVLLLALVGSVLLARRVSAAPAPVVTALMTKELTGIPGKECMMLSVTYPPGAVDSAHRHKGYAFVYVLEGSIVMGLNGGQEVTLKPGQTFYEGPDDLHTVGRNASNTKAARFIAVLIKDKGVPAVLPIE
jgi:quercetin dioxygenase-like cupin family protein